MKYKQMKLLYIFNQNKHGNTIMRINVPLKYVNKFISIIKLQNYVKLINNYTLTQNLIANFVLDYFMKNIFNKISVKSLLHKVTNRFKVPQHEVNNIIKNMTKAGIISNQNGYINILCQRHKSRKSGYINIIE